MIQLPATILSYTESSDVAAEARPAGRRPASRPLIVGGLLKDVVVVPVAGCRGGDARVGAGEKPGLDARRPDIRRCRGSLDMDPRLVEYRCGRRQELADQPRSHVGLRGEGLLDGAPEAQGIQRLQRRRPRERGQKIRQVRQRRPIPLDGGERSPGAAACAACTCAMARLIVSMSWASQGSRRVNPRDAARSCRAETCGEGGLDEAMTSSAVSMCPSAG